MLIGRDFLHTIDLTVKRGKATISPSVESSACDEEPELFRVNVVEGRNANSTDLSNVQNEEYKEAIQALIDDYNPVKTYTT